MQWRGEGGGPGHRRTQEPPAPVRAVAAYVHRTPHLNTFEGLTARTRRLAALWLLPPPPRLAVATKPSS